MDYLYLFNFLLFDFELISYMVSLCHFIGCFCAFSQFLTIHQLVSIKIGDLQCYKYKCEAILKLFQGYQTDEVELCFTFLRHLGCFGVSVYLLSCEKSVTLRGLAFMCCSSSLKVSRVQTRESLSSFGFPLRLKQKQTFCDAIDTSLKDLGQKPNERKSEVHQLNV